MIKGQSSGRWFIKSYPPKGWFQMAANLMGQHKFEIYCQAFDRTNLLTFPLPITPQSIQKWEFHFYFINLNQKWQRQSLSNQFPERLISFIGRQNIIKYQSKMSFNKVIKASKQHQSISSIVTCCQEKGFQAQPATNSIATQIKQKSLGKQSKETNKKESLWQNDSPSAFIHRFLLKNICSLNSLSDKKKHDYAECEGQQFVHSIQIKEEGKSTSIIETQTTKSQYLQSDGETESDCESMFEFIPELNLEFETVEIIPTQEI